MPVEARSGQVAKVVGEVDQQVDVESGFVLTAGHRSEDPRRHRVVFSDDRSDCLPVLVHSCRGRT